MSASSQTGHRLIAIGLFLGMPALLLTISTINLLQLADDQFTLAEKQMQLAAFMHRLTASAPDGKPIDLSPIYVAGTSVTLASANLQQYVVNAVTGAEGKLIETAVVDGTVEETGEPSDRVSVTASFEIDNDGLLATLRNLESGLPLLDVSALSVRRLSSEQASEKLRVDIEVAGRWRPKP